MRAVAFLLIFFSFGVFSEALPETLSKEQEDKVLFMLLENKDRKTTPIGKTIKCNKKTAGEWFCDNDTVKKFIMNSIGLRLDPNIQRNHEINCEKITRENRKDLVARTTPEFSSQDLKREISLAIQGQWVCSYKFTNKDIQAAETAADTTKPVATTTGSGISFIMNRELNRIIGQHLVVWRQ